MFYSLWIHKNGYTFSLIFVSSLSLATKSLYLKLAMDSDVYDKKINVKNIYISTREPYI